ncbi:MAG: hypothetical protein MPJ24_08335 [Pirellulaceae bacterium]|nr:hypothetical protein [Pirellulaceae bacterium]
MVSRKPDIQLPLYRSLPMSILKTTTIVGTLLCSSFLFTNVASAADGLGSVRSAADRLGGLARQLENEVIDLRPFPGQVSLITAATNVDILAERIRVNATVRGSIRTIERDLATINSQMQKIRRLERQLDVWARPRRGNDFACSQRTSRIVRKMETQIHRIEDGLSNHFYYDTYYDRGLGHSYRSSYVRGHGVGYGRHGGTTVYRRTTSRGGTISVGSHGISIGKGGFRFHIGK